MKTRRNLLLLWTDRAASTAVEFAVIAPVLAIVVLGIVDGWSYASDRLNVNIALKAATNYYLKGGTSDDTAQALAVSAWRNAPADADVVVGRTCTCSSVAVDCTASCTTGSSTPVTMISIDATGTWTAPLVSSMFSGEQSLASSVVLRVR